MSGVAIVRYLLSVNAPLIAVVPATRIAAGVLPLNTELPAIGVKEVDALQYLTVSMSSANRHMAGRVQVTVLAKTYPSKKQILALIRDALPISRGTVNGISCDSILPDLVGPDLDDPESIIFEQSQDFMVRWNE